MGVKRALEAKIALPLKRVASLLWFAAFSVCGSRFLLGKKRGFHQGGVVDRLFGADQSHWAEGRWANVNIKAGTKDYRPLASGGSREKQIIYDIIIYHMWEGASAALDAAGCGGGPGGQRELSPHNPRPYDINFFVCISFTYKMYI